MKLKISISHLSLGMRGDDVARVQQAMQVLGRIVPAGEKGVLGAGTVAVLKALQAELSLPATGVVDAATVRAINVKLANLSTDQRVVRGAVRDANGDPFAAGFVQLFSQGPNGEQVIGKSALNAADGTYQISYPPPRDNDGRIDLRVVVQSSSGAIVETTPSGTIWARSRIGCGDSRCGMAAQLAQRQEDRAGEWHALPVEVMNKPETDHLPRGPYKAFSRAPA